MQEVWEVSGHLFEYMKMLCVRIKLVNALFAAFVVCAIGCSSDSGDSQGVARKSGDAVDSFLAIHWERPLKAQGAPPEHWSDAEKSLSPEKCGACHPDQHAQWSTSFHSRAMSPGLLGQLLDMDPADSTAIYACLTCHTPSAEQFTLTRDFIQRFQAGVVAHTELENLDSTLFGQGLICINCHYREFTVFGPERKPELGSIPDEIRSRLPHGGWEISDAFEDSRFCATCHQFEEDGATIAGKLIENTYNEWAASSFAQEDGLSCQNCHMPDRRHEWRGIHDSVTVSEALHIYPTIVEKSNSRVTATLTLVSVKVGHNFPSYVTPKVYLEAWQDTRDVEGLTSDLIRDTVGWHVALDLSEEYFDTRVAPGDSVILEYDRNRIETATGIRFRVWVEPDAFYTQFFEAILSGGQTQYGTTLIQEALSESQTSSFVIYDTFLTLD